MKRIMLFCNEGMSTSSLIAKMVEAAKKENTECEITAHGVYDVYTVGKDADCILLGPQVRFQYEKIKAAMAPIPVACIDMRMYGMMDGASIYKQAKELIGL